MFNFSICAPEASVTLTFRPNSTAWLVDFKQIT